MYEIDVCMQDIEQYCASFYYLSPAQHMLTFPFMYCMSRSKQIDEPHVGRTGKALFTDSILLFLLWKKVVGVGFAVRVHLSLE